MIFSLLDIAKRNIFSNRAIMLIAFNGVVLSVALIVLMITFASQAQEAIINDARNRVGGFDAFIYGAITPEYVQAVTETEGVAQALAIHNDWLDVQSSTNPERQLPVYSIGTVDSQISRTRYEYTEEVLPGQAVISLTVSEFLEVDVGSHVIIDGKIFEVTELVGTLPGTSNFYDFALIVIHFDDFSYLINSQISNSMAVEFTDPRKAIEMHYRLKHIDDNMTVTLLIEALEESEEIESLKVFIYILAAIVVLACAFIVVSNFQMFIEGYKRQFSIMRTFGALGSQLRKIILVQGSIIIGGGAIAGFILALSLHSITFGFLSSVLSLSATIPMNYPVACLTTIVFSVIVFFSLLVTSTRCTQILPLQVLHEVDVGHELGNTGLFYGRILMGITTVLFLVSYILHLSGVESRGLGLAIILFFIPGLLLLTPRMISACLSVTQALTRAFSKGTAEIALANMKNNLATTKNIVLPIMVLFIVAIFGSAVLRTIHTIGATHIESTHFLDITVTDVLMIDSKLDMIFLEELATIEGSNNTVAVSYWDGFRLSDGAYDDGGFASAVLLSLKSIFASGELYTVNVDVSDAVVITRDFSQRHGVRVGDSLTIWYDPNMIFESSAVLSPIAESFTFSVVAVVDGFSFVHPTVDIFIDWENHVIPTDDFIFYQAFIRTDNIDRTIAELQLLRGAYPEIRWSTLESELEKSNRAFVERFGMFILVLALIFISISLGIISSVFGGIYRRRREYAVLRAIGTHKKVVARTVYIQVFLYVLVGAVIGSSAGTFLSFVLVSIIDGSALLIDYGTPLGVLATLLLALTLTIIPRVRKLLMEDILEQING